MYAVKGNCPSALRCKGTVSPSLPSLLRKPAGVARPGSRRTVQVKALIELHDMATTASHSLAQIDIAHHAQALYALADGAEPGSGPIDLLATGFENVLKYLDQTLESAGVPYSYGFAIILLTILVKLGTFPLSQKQVESTIAMQALQPKVKELQAKYADSPENLQVETARMYREAGVNPLAGCLPTLATIPVFIGLYRALTLAAQDGLLTQGFFWIPSLAGPASLAERDGGSGLTWLFPFVDGHPPIGWGPTVAYLILPALLVVSQYVSQKIVSTQTNTDPSQQSAQAILKFLPLMIGWFSLNVPSGLTLYWFVNNILSTAQQLYLKSAVKVNIPEAAVASTSASEPLVKPKEERVKKVTGKDLGARKKKRGEGEDSDVDVEFTSTILESSGSSSSSSSSNSNSNGKGGKGDKFRALKAREAAQKAASVSSVSSSNENKTE